MTQISQRIDRLSPTQRRLLLGFLTAAVLLALAMPVGLKSLTERAASTTSGSTMDRAATAGANQGPAAGSSADGSSGEAAAAIPAPAAPHVAGSGTAKGAAPLAVATGPKIARSAWLGIEVKDLTTSSGQVRSIASAAGGQVTSENVVTGANPTGTQGIPSSDKGSIPDIAPVRVNEARLSVSVPAGKLDGALTDLSRLGTVSYRSSQSQDVTDAYVDTSARIATMQAGVDSIRALLAKATSLAQVISLESELTSRQADLDSLKARLTSLDRQITMSDVTVTLWTTATKTDEATSDNAFVSTLRAAWDTFLTSMSVILTGLAALLPWLVIALLVALVLRRTLRDRFAKAAPSTTAPAGDPATTTD